MNENKGVSENKGVRNLFPENQPIWRIPSVGTTIVIRFLATACALLLVVGLENATGQSLLEKFFGGSQSSPKDEEEGATTPELPSTADLSAPDSPTENGADRALRGEPVPSADGSGSFRVRIPATNVEGALQQLPPQADEGVLPAPAERILVPLSDIGTPGEVRIGKLEDGRISLVVRDASLSRVLSIFAQSMALNIVASNDIDAVVSITLRNVPVEQALSAILSVVNYTWVEHDGIIYVTSVVAGIQLPADVQGRQIQVFPLDYVSGESVSEAVQGFLSPVGQIFTTESDEADTRKTQETVVVEDLPHVLSRVAAFIHQIDQPPRQVQIEAHILQVDLTDDRKHGVNFDHLFNVLGNSVSIRTVGLANVGATQAFFASIRGGNLTALVEALKSTTDVKTLASPKITVLNEQTAKIHVGEQLGYRVTTTTQTSTLQSVDFIDVGVVLSITPRISRDNRVLLNVKPEVSSGRINPDTGVPEEETTELQTSVMLDDGYGMVIGGLIKETDSVVQSKVPYLGDLWVIGKVFQRQQVIKDRSEIIIVLIPRVLPYCGEYEAYEQGQIARAGTPLLEGPLLRRARPWNPRLPDAITNPRVLRLPPVGRRYRYPAFEVEYAATPQPQREYPVPSHPGPAFRGITVGDEYPMGPVGDKDVFGQSEIVERPSERLILPEYGRSKETLPQRPVMAPEPVDIEPVDVEPADVEPAASDVSNRSRRRWRKTVLAWWLPSTTGRDAVARPIAHTESIAPSAPTIGKNRSKRGSRIVRLPTSGGTE